MASRRELLFPIFRSKFSHHHHIQRPRPMS